jgi:16S rRNA (guanine(966)-N(2))-methyltransferase RsmD
VRQALFNVLRECVEDAIFMDLFAGTGSVGLEALSRGARQGYFVEHDPRTLRVLRANVDACAMTDRATIVASTLPQALGRLPGQVRADVIFLDPPYASDLGEQTLEAIGSLSLLAPHGVVIWQHTAYRCAPALVRGLSLWQSRGYGNTQLSFYVLSGYNRIGVGSDDALGRAEAGHGAQDMRP